MLQQRTLRARGACSEPGASVPAPSEIASMLRRQPFKAANASGTYRQSTSSFVARMIAHQRQSAYGSSTRQKLVVRASSAAAAAKQDYRSKPAKQVNVLVVGPTGYIGRFVTKELLDRGYNVIALAREKAGIKGKMSKDDTIKPVDVVVSCLASRTGGKKDSWLIDYQATKNVLDVAREKGAQHFVLLSAICVQKPLLEFQRAKLKLETDLQAAGDITYSIVRPTAFFKSLAGQIKLVQDGKPYVMFGDGNLASCKPISEQDLAKFMADCVTDENMVNAVLPIGGPGKALSAKEQAEILFRLTGLPPKFFPVPIGLMDGIIKIFDFLAKIFPQLEDSAEFGRIGRYYAAESMLVWDEKTQQYDADATPSYGTDTLEAFFARAIKEGLKGQELGDQAVFGVGE